MREANLKLKKPTFLKEIGPISNFFLYQIQGNRDFFLKNCFM